LDFFASIDVAVFPSTWDEPFGLVVAEAMAAGVPFVVSDAGALPEVAGENHPWVARAGDSQDLARVIRAAWTAVRSGTAPTAAARTRWELEYSPTAGSERLATMLTTLGVLA
jgi:glycosyltransferase involved in cell wall biosynthesis